MIGWVVERVVELVLAPQATALAPVGGIDRRAYVDPDAAPLNVNATELDVLASSTVPIGREIGGGLNVRHELEVGLAVEHGDPAIAKATRDAIALDLSLRLLEQEANLLASPDPDGRQTLERLSWRLDYRPIVVDTPNEYARLVITVDAYLDR